MDAREAGVEGGSGGMEMDGAADQFEGLGVMAGLGEEEAEEVKGVGVVGIGGEDFLVDGLGVAEAAGLVMLEGEGEGLGESEVGFCGVGHGRFFCLLE